MCVCIYTYYHIIALIDQICHNYLGYPAYWYISNMYVLNVDNYDWQNNKSWYHLTNQVKLQAAITALLQVVRFSLWAVNIQVAMKFKAPLGGRGSTTIVQRDIKTQQSTKYCQKEKTGPIITQRKKNMLVFQFLLLLLYWTQPHVI